MADWRFRPGKNFWLKIIIAIVIGALGLAYQTYAQGDWSWDRLEARAELYRWQLVLRKDPSNHDALLGLGVDYYVLKDLTKSLAAYSQAVAAWPESFVAWNNLGNVKRDLVDFWGAEEAYLKAIEIKPDYVTPYINLADLYAIWPVDEEGDKQVKKIVPLLQRGVTANPGSEDLQTALKAYVSANKQ